MGVNLFVDLPKVGIIYAAYTKSVAGLLPCMTYATDQHHWASCLIPPSRTHVQLYCKWHPWIQITAEKFTWILSQNLKPSKKKKCPTFWFRLFAETGGRIWPLKIGHVCNELAEAWVKLCVHFLHGILRYTCTF